MCRYTGCLLYTSALRQPLPLCQVPQRSGLANRDKRHPSVERGSRAGRVLAGQGADTHARDDMQPVSYTHLDVYKRQPLLDKQAG